MAAARPISIIDLLRQNKSVSEIKMIFADYKANISPAEFNAKVLSAIDTLTQLPHDHSLIKNSAASKKAEIDEIIIFLKTYLPAAEPEEKLPAKDHSLIALDEARKNYAEYKNSKSQISLARAFASWFRVEDHSKLNTSDNLQLGEALVLATQRRSLMPIFSYMTFENRQLFILQTLGTTAGLLKSEFKPNDEERNAALDMLSPIIGIHFVSKTMQKIHELEKADLNKSKDFIRQAVAAEFKKAYLEQKQKAEALANAIPHWDLLNKNMIEFFYYLVGHNEINDEKKPTKKLFVLLATEKQKAEFDPKNALPFVVEMKRLIELELTPIKKGNSEKINSYIRLLEDLHKNISTIEKGFPKQKQNIKNIFP